MSIDLLFESEVDGSLAEVLSLSKSGANVAYNESLERHDLALEFKQEIAGLKARPNILIDYSDLFFFSNKAGEGEMIIYDVSGRKINHQKIIVIRGDNQISINRAELNAKPGVYYVEIVTDNKYESAALIIAE